MADFDEAERPILHTCLSVCRQLMFASPMEGVLLDQITLKGQAGLKPGWNKEDLGPEWETGYLFLEPGKHAHRTPRLPEGVDESSVNIIRPVVPADARNSELWAIANKIAPFVEMLGPLPTGLPSVQAVMNSIESFSSVQRSKDALMPSSAKIIQELFATEMNLGNPNSPDPAVRIAEQYMRFEVPGIVARYVLSALYHSLYEKVPRLFKKSAPPIKRYLTEKIEELADVTYQLATERHKYDVSGFFNASYLACLCGGTVIVMCSNEDNSLTKLGFSAEEQKRLQRVRQNVDEILAHHPSGAFVLPAHFVPAQILFYVLSMAAAQGRPLHVLAEESSLHPALAAILDQPGAEAMNVDQVLEHYLTNIEHLPHLGMKAILQRASDALKVKLYDWVQ
jgi:hypothetical protein